jgi:hypothetical protein
MTRALYLLWSRACVLALIVLIAGRWLRYATGVTPPGLDRVLREFMVFDSQAFLWPWVCTTGDLRLVVVALAVAAVGLHRRLPGLLVARADGRWRLTPLAVSALLAGMLWANYAFDVNPTLALVCAGTLALTMVGLPGRLAAAVWTAVFAAALVAAGDWVDRVTIAVWAVVLLATQQWLAPRARRADVLLLRTLAVVPVSLLSTMLPLLAPFHGGVRLGDGLAYAFCEVPARRALYASIPVCGSVWVTYDECRTGHVAEYSLDDMRRVATHRFFSPDFYGRFEFIDCLDDEVEVAVQAAVIRGGPRTQTALAFPVDAPNTFDPQVAGENVGITIAYDRAHAAVFYAGEFTHRVVRYDRRTGERREVGGRALARRWIQPITLREFTGSSILYTNTIHQGRNRLYVAEWLQGRYAYAIDLDTLEVVARYDVGGGGALGLTVDEGRDRLYVSSVWGLEVFDLATDRLVTRKRTGLGNRPVVVDAPRNRLYLGSMVEGKIRILDRDTLAVLGQIPVGIGGRFSHLSLDGRYLFASSSSAHYYWDADTLLPGG